MREHSHPQGCLWKNNNNTISPAGEDLEQEINSKVADRVVRIEYVKKDTLIILINMYFQFREMTLQVVSRLDSYNSKTKLFVMMLFELE